MKNNRAGDTSQRCGNSPAIIFSQQSAYDLNKLVKPKTAAELCDKAKEIGFVDADTPQALYFFERIGYQHASEYFDLFMINGKLDEGASIKAVNEAIVFDRRIQAILLEYIGVFELQFRARMSYVLSLNRGAFAHLNKNNFKNETYFNSFIERYHEEVERKLKAKNGTIIAAYETYQEIPVWLAMEVLSIGTLSKLFRNIKKRKIRHEIADFFGVKAETLDSWLKSIAQVRNNCAHFSRVCGRKLASMPLRIPGIQKADNSRVFYMILILEKLLACSTVFPDDLTLSYAHNLAKDAVNLIHNNLKCAKLFGLPENWEELLLNSNIMGMECHIHHIIRPPLPGLNFVDAKVLISDGYSSGLI